MLENEYKDLRASKDMIFGLIAKMGVKSTSFFERYICP